MTTRRTGAGARSADADGPPDPATEDVAAWNGYLTQNGPAWDGAEESWQSFRDWFAYHAAAAGIGCSAEAFLAYAEAGPDKVAIFAEYGIALDAAAGESDATGPDGPDEDGFGEGDLATLFAESVPGDLAAELAGLSEQELAALAEEVAALVEQSSASA